MYQLPQIKSYRRPLHWLDYLAAAIVVICLLVLARWQFDIRFLRRPFSRFVSVNPMTAVLFLVITVSLLLAGRKISGIPGMTERAAMVVGNISFQAHWEKARLYPLKFHPVIIYQLKMN